jgi:hypothetical protein
MTTRTRLSRDLSTTYPLKDSIPYKLAQALGIKNRFLPSWQQDGYKEVKAVWTGEKRPPKKGEWYLSGAEIGAYLAPNDLAQPYHIAKLVKVKTFTSEVIEPINLDVEA